MAIITGTAADDTLAGTASDDTVSALGGNDSLDGGDGSDTLTGGAGDDRLYSHAIDPLFAGFKGISYDTFADADILNGDAGDDYIFAGYGDTIDGGASGTFGDRLFISFQGATSGVSADFQLLLTQTTMTVGTTTISNIDNVGYLEGSEFNDFLVGLDQGPYPGGGDVYGRGGNDHILAQYYTGWAGSSLHGDDGDDIVDARLSGYGGNVYGDDGNDTLYTASTGEGYGGAGNDTIYARNGAHGGDGDDRIEADFSGYSGGLFGDAGDDEIVLTIATAGQPSQLSGGAGADVLTGNASNDTLVSGDMGPEFDATNDTGIEHDVLAGLGGDDLLVIGYGDSADGGSGSDRLRLSLAGRTSGMTLNTAAIISGQPFALGGGTIQNVEGLERLHGTSFADVLTIATQAEWLTVEAGDGYDNVTSSGSRVILLGGNGDDTLTSGTAGDVFGGGDGHDLLISGSGAETFYGDSGSDTVDYRNAVSGVTVTLAATESEWGTGANGDQLNSVENVTGSAHGDTLNGNDGDNILKGGGGNDVLAGLGGHDTYYVDTAGDVVSENAGGGMDAVFASVNYTLAAGQEIEALFATGSAVTLTGNEYGQRIFGSSAANVLIGAGGDDWLDGGFGIDTMTGGLGDDAYSVHETGDQVIEAAGQGVDRVFAYASWVIAAGQEIEMAELGDVAGALDLTGNAFGNQLLGNAAANILTGGGGNDSLWGGAGGDTMIGGTGNDFYYVDSVGDQVIEADGEGHDELFTLVSYTLSATQSIETLGFTVLSSTLAVELRGNDWANNIYGNAGAGSLFGMGGNDLLQALGGNDHLDGGTGVDTMYGGEGDDTYVVDNAGDRVFESDDQGFDQVVASVSFALLAGQQVERVRLADGIGALNLTGNDLANHLIGNAGANVLNGLGGNDTMIGGAGNDTYHVDAAGDAVVEVAGGGTDVVYAGATFTLGAGQEVEVLSTSSLAGTTAINLTGNDLGQTIYGNAGVNSLNGGGGNDTLIALAGNDVLNGSTGNDTMNGGAGNDTFYVDAAGDVVQEAAAGGSDVVYAGVSYTLGAAAEIEVLSTSSLAGTTAINLIGNGFAQTIYGNAGVNSLNGGGGNDTLIALAGNDVLNGSTGNDTMNGGAGNDTFYVDAAGDVVQEAAAGGSDVVYAGVSYTLGAAAEIEVLSTSSLAATTSINLTGNALGQTIYGNAGANVLNGLGGNDVLVGLGGADTFAFTTALGAGNVDTVSGYVVADDTIQLENAVFTGLAAGALAAGAFATGASATQADDRIIYNSASGALLFDADGVGGAAAAQFATLAGGLALTSADFIVI